MMTDTTKTLAELLRVARTARGYSREQLATVTRVPLAFITAIETENSADLPKAVFCHGFLRIIARHLHLEPVPLLAAYAELQPAPAASFPLLSTNDVLIRQHKRTVCSRRKNLLRVTLVLLLLSGVVFYFLHLHMTTMLETPPPAAADNEPSMTSAEVPPLPLPTATTSVPAPVRQHLRLQVIRPLQVDISIDDGEREHRMLLPQSYEFEFERQAQLTVADTTAVKLWFNGEALGNLARGGRRRVLIFKAVSRTTARTEENAGHHFQR